MRVRNFGEKIILRGFRVMLFRMVPKLMCPYKAHKLCFRVMLFRMVPKHFHLKSLETLRFRVMLFRMAPKLIFM